MRSPQEIRNKLENEFEHYDVMVLRKNLEQNTDGLALLISDVYEKAFLNALRHRPNGELVLKFATLTWIAGSDLNITAVSWLQYGMPRIRRMANELKLPWIPTGDNELTIYRAKRMSNGLPCLPRCFRCFHG